MSMKSMPVYKEGEEIINAMTHGFAAILSVFGSVLLIRHVYSKSNFNRLIGIIVFSLSMITLYTISMLYHGLGDGEMKRIMRYSDHCSVFILIAGTYTPFTLTILSGPSGTMILIIVWSIALIGIFGTIFFFEAMDRMDVYLYIAMGWTILISLKTFIEKTPRNGLILLLTGGLSYTLGTYFFVNDKYVKYYHAIFHIFIIMGTVLHYIAVWNCC